MPTLVHSAVPPRIKATLDGKRKRFATVEDKFRALVRAWQRVRDHGSSSMAELNHPIYLQIIGLGAPAIPLLLAEMQLDTGHWFTALSAITGETVITHDMRGDFPRMIDAWLAWGASNGYCKRVVDVGSPAKAPRGRRRFHKPGHQSL